MLPYDQIDAVKGFLDRDEGNHLYETALKAAPWGPCLEIGSYCGKSTIYLGKACQAHGQVLFAVDHHQGSEEQQPGQEYFDPDLLDARTGKIDTFHHFRQTLALTGLEDTVAPLVCRSGLAARAWTTPLSLIFIDGGHAYETVYTDYKVWTGHLRVGGFLMIHDIFQNPDEGGQAPYQVYQLALASGLYEALPQVKTLGVLRRLG